ncbi:MAG: GAF domain-containing protein, partial [Chloroflexota bacterium]
MASTLFSLRVAAAQLGVHHTTLSRAVRRGELEPDRSTPRGHLRFAPESVERYGERLRSRRLGAVPRGGEMEAFRRATLLVASELRPDVVLQRLAGEARRLVGARYAALGVMDAAGNIRQFFTEGLTAAERTALGPLPRGRGLLGALFHEGVSLMVADISSDPRSSGFPPHHPPMRSLLGVPIVDRGLNVGNIYLTDKENGEAFMPDDRHLIEDLARFAAAAIRNAKRYEQATNQARLWKALTRVSRKIAASTEPRKVL